MKMFILAALLLTSLFTAGCPVFNAIADAGIAADKTLGPGPLWTTTKCTTNTRNGRSQTLCSQL